MKLAIVGSVSLDGNLEAYRIIREVIDKYKPDTIVSGGAKGVDSMAKEAAKENRIETRIFLPKVNRWEGYKERNLLIAKECDVLVRIAAKDSKTYGSGWTRDRAKEFGKQVEEFLI